MGTTLDVVETEFSQLSHQPAGFDKPFRQEFGLWTLDTPVSVREFLERCRATETFTTADGWVKVPLHEEGSSTLTGEYVEYHPTAEPPCIRFFDYGSRSWDTVAIDEFVESYPAYRLRFWDATQGSANEANATTTRSPEGAPRRTPNEDMAARQDSSELALDADRVVAELRGFVEREREAERNAARERFARLTPREYQRTAGVIPELHPAGIEIDDYGQQLVKLRLPERVIEGPVDITDEFGIYPESEVIIGSLDDDDGFPVEATVVDIEGRQLGLGVYWDRNEASVSESAFDVTTDTEYWLGELLNPVPYDRILDAIGIVDDDDRKHGLLTGETPLSFTTGKQWELDRSRLNSDQETAAEHALDAEDVFCIHGPPGTGKTRTLLEIVKAASAAGARVLVCAHSNQAVDNLLVGNSTADTVDENSLHAAVENGDLTAARVGTNSDHPLVDSVYAANDRYQSDVVCTTMSGAHAFGENRFDIAVIDEATQASTAAAMIPFTRADSVVLAGDHKQLPPYHSGEQSGSEEVEVSLFEHLLGHYGGEVVATLRTQYRMHEDIAAFPNREFYGGELSHGIANRYRTIGALPALDAVEVTGTEKRTPSNSMYNEAEIEAVLDELANLQQAAVDPASIGVITPYAGQVSKLQAAVNQRFDAAFTTDLLVDTIDSFQGSERDAIVISFVRSNDRNEGGFLKFPVEGPRRLNVAMTRAKKRLVLVGDFETLKTPEDGTAPGDTAASVYQRLYQHLSVTGVV